MKKKSIIYLIQFGVLFGIVYFIYRAYHDDDSSQFNVVQPKRDQSNILIKTGFEDCADGMHPTIKGWGLQGNDSSIAVTSQISRSGKKSLKISFTKSQWFRNSRTNNRRAEILSDELKGMDLGKDWWVGFSEYIPADWEDDLKRNSDIVWQFHGAPSGPGGASPPLAAYVEQGIMTIVTRVGRRPSKLGDGETLAQFPIPKGKWTDWVIKVNFDYDKGSVKIWKDGNVVVDYNGPNIYQWTQQKNEEGPYMKFGVYKPSWREYPTVATKRELFIDDITIAGSNGTYDKVKPGH